MTTGSHWVRWSWSRPWRWAKTIFFLFAMLTSLLLLVAPPLLAAVIDLLLPLAAVLSADSNSPISASVLSAQLKSFDFQTSLVDLPLVSAGRCLLILCAYVVCDGRRGLYLSFTTLCSLLSIAYLLLKAVSMCMAASSPPWRPRLAADGKDMVAIEALFLSSFALAVAHVVVAYRGSWRERRKLLLFRIDVEAVSICNVICSSSFSSFLCRP
ncbi:unnamed protein product [Musa acuminata subsp. malaccensis]|uniref:(wild Malaysian banana) hypothetical protein n=1 Tax=Musa acuminata subsp. malaccensis TaxID=214687 RepID=A0A804L9R2_MUSAM|nr:unnamed protein product [Musa acuminata subsp. malaccensis]